MEVGWRPCWQPRVWRSERAARGSAGGRYELGLRAGGPGRRRRLREHESAAAAAATAATAVEGARWPRSGPGDPVRLTAAAATRSGRGSRSAAPAPPPAPPAALPHLAAPPLLPPPSSLAGRARHGAASPPMALRRSMGRSGLLPLPLPPPSPPLLLLLLLAGLAALLLPESAAAGRGWLGGTAESGVCGGARLGSEPGDSSRANPGPGRAGDLGWGTQAGRPRLGHWGEGAQPGVRTWICGRGPRPQLSRVRGSSVGVEGRGVGQSAEWSAGGVWDRIFPPRCS